jgi:hypothetical protein
MDEIVRLIEAEIPRLRRYARALLRDQDRADDLVQDTLSTKFTSSVPATFVPGSSRSCTISMSIRFGVPSGRARKLSWIRCSSRRQHHSYLILSSASWKAPLLDFRRSSERRCFSSLLKG